MNPIGLNGAKLLSKIVYKVKNISVLDLTETDLGDEGIAELVQGLRNNYSITRYFSRRYQSIYLSISTSLSPFLCVRIPPYIILSYLIVFCMDHD